MILQVTLTRRLCLRSKCEAKDGRGLLCTLCHAYKQCTTIYYLRHFVLKFFTSILLYSFFLDKMLYFRITTEGKKFTF